MTKLASPLRTALVRTGKYGNRGAGAGGVDAPANHLGVDVRAAIGTPVYAPLDGVVVQVTRAWSPAARGPVEGSVIFGSAMAGNVVVIRGALDGAEVDVNLAHLDSVAASLRVGGRVHRGETLLGAAGVTGVKQPHVHLGVFRLVRGGGKATWIAIDPTPLLPWDGDKFGEDIAADDEEADVDWTRLQKMLNETEKRIRDDMKVNVADEVRKSVAAAEEARDALVKPSTLSAPHRPIDVLVSHAPANAKAIREVKQAVDAASPSGDSTAVADQVLDQLGEAIVKRNG